MKQVWILDEGSQGHVVQSRGLVRELGKLVDLQSTEIPARLAVRSGFGRSMVKRMLRRWDWEWVFHASHEVGEPPPGKPDLIVSSGPRSMLALKHLSARFGCPSVFVQGTVDVPEGMFTAIMRPFEGRRRDDFIFIPLLFTEITPELLAEARNAYLARTGVSKTAPLKALFIGQSSAKIRFSPDDWDLLAGMVNTAFGNDGIRWLITTSYRTGLELEEQLRGRIEAGAVHDAVWYGSAPRKVTKEFLGMADSVYVTMDSLTMLTEAISSGLPVTAIRPASHVLDPADSHHRYIDQLGESGLLRIQSAGDAVSERAHEAPVIDYSAPVHELIRRLKWFS